MSAPTAPYRRSDDAAPPSTVTTVDPVEREATQAIADLRLAFKQWMHYTSAITGNALGMAAHGVGQGIAKITDALVRLRQQKIGS